MIDLTQEREVFEHDRKKPQILDGENYVENVNLAIGFASRCWKEEVFDTESALRLGNELCAYIRAIKEGRAL